MFEFLEPFGQAVKAKRVQMVERRMSEHEDILSMVVAGTAQIGVVEERGGTAVLARRVSRLRARREATPLQLRTPSSTARADTASRRTGSRPR